MDVTGWRLGSAAAVVLVASVATLVLELVASRVLAPFLGSSLHTWTTIIGVVLLGIALGSAAGGRLADRGASTRTLAAILAGAGAATLSVLGLVALLGDGASLRPLPLLPRTVLLTSLGFFPATFALALVTPVALRLVLPDVRRSGRAVGLVSALGTVGSLAGNYLTGFVLIARYPVPGIVVAVALALFAAALLAAVGPVQRLDAPSAGGGPRPGGGADRPGGAGRAAAVSEALRLSAHPGLAGALLAFTAFCTLALELSASRLLAPAYGVSLFSWTGIIGVVLAGIALGNALGGAVADAAGAAEHQDSARAAAGGSAAEHQDSARAATRGSAAAHQDSARAATGEGTAEHQDSARKATGEGTAEHQGSARRATGEGTAEHQGSARRAVGEGTAEHESSARAPIAPGQGAAEPRDPARAPNGAAGEGASARLAPPVAVGLAPSRALAVSLLASGGLCLLVPPLNRLVLARDAFGGLPLAWRIVAHTAVVFLLPVTALGTISPQVIRLALTDVSRAGRVAGRLWAFGSLGALVGTFLTGWWLVAAVGVHALVAGAGVALVLVAAALGGAFGGRRLVLGGVALLALAASLGWLGLYRSGCTEETGYFCITVVDTRFEGREVRALRLDLLTHTLTDLRDPGFLGYEHDYIHSELVRRAAERSPSPEVLVIGGGGYVLPRWIQHFVPAAHVDVVEIDPAVTRVALAQFDVAPATRITSYNVDGRQFLQELAGGRTWDLVVQDAVSDLSVPWHLMTREYDLLVRARLKPGGVYLLSVIDDVPRGPFLRSALRTMQGVFPHVALLYDARRTGPVGQGVYVLAGSLEPLDVEALHAAAQARGEPSRTAAATPAQLDAELDAGPARELTDAWAPVDNLLAELFLLRQ